MKTPPRVRKDPVRGHVPKARWPLPALRAWLLELMEAYEGNMLQAAKAVGRQHQQIARWLRVLGINNRDFYPAARLHERRGRITALHLTRGHLRVSLTLEGTNARLIMVASPDTWAGPLGAHFGERVTIQGIHDRTQSQHALVVQSVTPLSPRRAAPRRRPRR